VTKKPFIIFTSNIFAILGLRSLYFVLVGAMEYFRFLKYGLSLVLVFIGSKMLVEKWVEIPSATSLIVVGVILLVSIIVSLMLVGRSRRIRSKSVHEPLSTKLAQIVEANATGDGITLNELLERTEGRGFYLVIIFLALPFIVPLSIPGLSTVLGLAITLLSLRVAVGRSARLPRFMGERRLSSAFQRNVLTGGVKFLRFVEKLLRPRRTAWMSTRPARFTNALLIALMGLLLALPFPPFPPLTNALPVTRSFSWPSA